MTRAILGFSGWGGSTVFEEAPKIVTESGPWRIICQPQGGYTMSHQQHNCKWEETRPVLGQPGSRHSGFHCLSSS